METKGEMRRPCILRVRAWGGQSTVRFRFRRGMNGSSPVEPQLASTMRLAADIAFGFYQNQRMHRGFLPYQNSTQRTDGHATCTNCTVPGAGVDGDRKTAREATGCPLGSPYRQRRSKRYRDKPQRASIGPKDLIS
jgi:hypothetical protein